MSNRKNAFNSESSNPAKVFLEWKSNDKCFAYYDKDKKENVKIPLPFTFVVLEEMHTVKGWNDASGSGIFSNEVKFISKEELTVKAFKGGEIAKGLYSEIKPKINNAGGVYHKSLYVMSTDGELMNVSFKGAAVKEWGEFTQKTRTRLTDEWVTVAEAKEGKKGSVTFNTPVFKFDGSLDDAHGQLADSNFDILEAYLKSYKAKVEQPEVVEETTSNASLGDPYYSSGDDCPI